jgi:hypothetical protein
LHQYRKILHVVITRPGCAELDEHQWFGIRQVSADAQFHQCTFVARGDFLSGLCIETPRFNLVRNEPSHLEATVNVAEALQFIVIIFITSRSLGQEQAGLEVFPPDQIDFPL